MAAADADKGLSGKNDEKFAIMRWLNDKNKVSVLSTKYIIEPKKGVYYPADIGISKFPGSRKIWNFRILNIGDEAEMNLWLNKNEDFLRVNQNDRFSAVGTPKKLLLQSESSETPEKLLSASNDFEISEQTPVKLTSESRTPKKKQPSPANEKKQPTPEKLLSKSLFKSEDSLLYLQKDVETPRRKRIRKLEEEVKNLRDDLRSLKKKWRKLEDSTQKKEEHNPVETKKPIIKQPVQNETKVHVPVKDESKQSAAIKQQVKDESVKESLDIPLDINKKYPVKCFQHITKSLFSIEELILCSPTGKRTIKCDETKGARPPLNRAKKEQLYRLAEEHLDFDRETSHKKLENFQKVLRRTK